MGARTKSDNNNTDFLQQTYPDVQGGWGTIVTIVNSGQQNTDHVADSWVFYLEGGGLHI